MDKVKNMNSAFFSLPEKTLPNAFHGKIVVRNWTIRHIGAGIGLLGGLLILFGANFLIIFEYFEGAKQRGTWLLAVVLPLWILGAHCFDKIEDSDKKRRAEFDRKIESE